MSDDDGAEALAEEMVQEVVAVGQSARRVADASEATLVRESLRRWGRAADVRLRTARMDDLVVVARLDAAIWSDDAATMRAKLAPPSDSDEPGETTGGLLTGETSGPSAHC